MHVNTQLRKLFVFTLLIFGLTSQGLFLKGQEQHDPLKYEVSVQVTSMPFVAVDSNGRPVTDLKKEELELFVNGKLTPIQTLIGTVFSDMEAPETKPSTTQALEPVKKVQRQEPPKRLIIIVVDVLFNSKVGLTQSKQVAQKLIEKGTKNDLFVLVQIELGGLKYIAGPAPPGEQLLQNLDKVRKLPHTVRIFTPFTSDRKIAAGLRDSQYMFMSKYGSRRSMRVSVEMYQDAFKQLKNALRSYDGLKLTYLLSESFAGHLDEHRLVRRDAYNLVMKEIENKVNDGGSVLQYVPIRGMRPHMIQDVAQWLTRSTSAFYELFFTPGRNAGRDMKLELRSKRPGVRINAAGHKEREKPYKEMNKVQKKTFVIGVATGLNWKRLPGYITRAGYEEQERIDSGELAQRTILIELPEQLMDQRLDVYLLRFDDLYQSVDIVKNSREVIDTAVLSLKPSAEKKNLFFVLVEPESGYCIFNQVR